MKFNNGMRTVRLRQDVRSVLFVAGHAPRINGIVDVDSVTCGNIDHCAQVAL